MHLVTNGISSVGKNFPFKFATCFLTSFKLYLNALYSGNVVKYFFISTTKCFELKLYSIIREKYFLYVSALKVVCFESDADADYSKKLVYKQATQTCWFF
jgi:hypothetical protein